MCVCVYEYVCIYVICAVLALLAGWLAGLLSHCQCYVFDREQLYLKTTTTSELSLN